MKKNPKYDQEHHISIHQRCEKKVGARCFSKMFAFVECIESTGTKFIQC